MFRRLSSSLIAVALILGVSGCGHGSSSQVASQPPIVKPANPKDTAAWRTYMGQVADPQTHSMARPYKFLVSAGDDPMDRDQRKMVEGALRSMAANNAFPGNMIAVGGPDPVKTADVLVAAFGKAKPASLKALTVLYIGDEANQPRVEKVVTDSGATYHYSGL